MRTRLNTLVLLVALLALGAGCSQDPMGGSDDPNNPYLRAKDGTETLGPPSIAIASGLFVARMGKSIIKRQYSGDQVRSKKVRSIKNNMLLEQRAKGIIVYELNGPLFFGSADNLARETDGGTPSSRSAARIEKRPAAVALASDMISSKVFSKTLSSLPGPVSEWRRIDCCSRSANNSPVM